MVDRRRFVRAASCGVLVAPLFLRAQGAAKIRRIGWLSPRAQLSLAEIEEQMAPLRALGWHEGRNLLVERRFTQAANAELLRSAAQDLVRLQVELIVAEGTGATLAAKSATRSIPIVMRSAGDPVGSGLVASLARPGGNVTGYSVAGPDIAAKGIELLRALVPDLQRVGVLTNPGNPYSRAQRGAVEQACRSLAIEPIFVQVAAASELRTAVAEAARRSAQALVLEPDPLFIDNSGEIIRAALAHALPMLGNGREDAEAGALVAFDLSLAELRRRGAAYIDKILRGARPADLPIEQPTQFVVAINLVTAKALGITVPPALLLRADVLIQ